MSDERAELVRLVHEPPDHQVPVVLAVLRRSLAEPTCFASAPGDVTSTADQLLDDGFGR